MVPVVFASLLLLPGTSMAMLIGFGNMSYTFDEPGYQRVAALKDNEAMKSYIHEAVTNQNRQVIDEGALSGFAQFYSGVVMAQSWARLQEELMTASWVGPKKVGQEESTTSAPISTTTAAHQDSTTPAPISTTRAAHQDAAHKRERAAHKKEPAAPKKEAAAAHSELPKANVEDAARHHHNRHEKSHKEAKSDTASALLRKMAEKETTTTSTTTAATVEATTVSTSTPKPVKALWKASPHAAKEKDASVASTASVSTSTAPRDATKYFPAVSDVMRQVSGSLEDFSARAKMMQKMVAQKQAQSKVTLLSLKSQYEAKLKEQLEANKAIEASSREREQEILKLQTLNEMLMNTAEAYQKSILTLRDSMNILSGKVGVAIEFTKDSVNITDLSGDEATKVLHPEKPAPTLETYLEAAREELGLKAPLNSTTVVSLPSLDEDLSLLQTGDSTAVVALPSMNPELNPEGGSKKAEALLGVVSKSLEALGKAQEAGKTALSEHFEKKHKAGEERRLGLLKIQDVLDGQRNALKDKQALLVTALRHLKDTRTLLHGRLASFSVFIDKLNATLGAALGNS